MDQGSPRLRLGKADYTKLGKGLGIALAGSGLAYLGTDVLPVLPDLGMGWLAPFAAFLVNVGLKFVSDTRP